MKGIAPAIAQVQRLLHLPRRRLARAVSLPDARETVPEPRRLEMNWKESACLSGVGTTVALALCFATAAGAGAAPTAACSQLTKAQVQSLLVSRVTKLTVTPVPGILYGSSAKQVGQTCTFADTETSNALTVVVIAGSSAARAYKSELTALALRLHASPW